MSKPVVADTFSCASDIFGFDIATLMEQGPDETLNKTLYAQAAIVSLSISLTRLLAEKGIAPSAALGFSLGQVSALFASDMLSLEETFHFAKVRAEAMDAAATASSGAMCALLGAEEQTAQQLCEECAEGEVLVVANYNCPGQIVISGTSSAVDRAHKAWGAQKKRSAMLATSGAFHSPLMGQAAAQVKGYLKKVDFKEASVPLICNVDAMPLGPERATEHLSLHLTNPVKFQQSVQNLIQNKASLFVEVGFGGVLTGLVKRIDRSLMRVNIDSLASLEAFFEQQKGE